MLKAGYAFTGRLAHTKVMGAFTSKSRSHSSSPSSSSSGHPHRYMLTVSQDDAVNTALPLLFGSWTLNVSARLRKRSGFACLIGLDNVMRSHKDALTCNALRV